MNERTVLIIDSEPHLLEMMTLILSHQGHQVIAARSTHEAHCWLIENGLPDIVIIGDLFPLADASLSLLCDIRTMSIGQNVPIIMLTTQARTEQIREGLDNGTDVYMTKPFSSRTLTSTIEKLLAVRSVG